MAPLSAKEIILEYVCPCFGMILGNFMFAAPVQDLKAAIEKGDLGSLNPTPWGFMMGNCMGWVLYGTLLKNMWVFFGNAPGLLISIWLNLGAVKLLYQGHHVKEMRESTVAFLDKKEQQPRIPAAGDEDNETATNSTEDWATIIYNVTSQATPAPARHEAIVMFMSTLWVILGTILAFVDAMDFDAKVFMVGIVTNCIVFFFYGAPLSTIFTVLKERDSVSIHIPTMILNTANASFWCAYGLAISDYFIGVPNGLGAIFGGIQIFLYMTFPRSSSSSSSSGGAKDATERGSGATQETQVGNGGSSTQIASRDAENGFVVASA